MTRKATDATVTPQDILAALRQLREDGIGVTAATLLQREPALGELIVERWNKVQTLLRSRGLTEEQARPVLIEVCRLTMEPLMALELSHRRMWQDFLPDVDEGNDQQGQ